MASGRVVCDGSGHPTSNPITCESGTRRALCAVCGFMCLVTRYGKLRKHDAIASRRSKPVKPEIDDQLAVEPSLRQLRDDAGEMKAQLDRRYQRTRDPRYRRLWQHALTLQTHLAQLHDDEANGSAVAGLRLMSKHLEKER